MRPGQKNNRSRGRGQNNRRGSNPLSRNYESNGPDIKVRGNANMVAEKYMQLARDAQTSGDPVMAENYFQHAEHYFRIISSAQANQQANQQQSNQQRDGASQGAAQGAAQNSNQNSGQDTNRSDTKSDDGDAENNNAGEQREPRNRNRRSPRQRTDNVAPRPEASEEGGQPDISTMPQPSMRNMPDTVIPQSGELVAAPEDTQSEDETSAEPVVKKPRRAPRKRAPKKDEGDAPAQSAAPEEPSPEPAE